MTYEPNSVHFTGDGKPYRVQEPKKLPALVDALKDRAISQLYSLLCEMLDNADDALFDLADKAGSNKDQSMYFDSMRELRIKRKGIENLFRQDLNNAFRLLTLSGDTAKPDVVSFNLDNIALVKEDELEENLAVEAMIKKAQTRNELAIRHLLLRISSLIPGLITEQNNPLNAQPIGKAFSSAVRTLALDIKAVLIIYKLFERFVLNHLDVVYAELNAFLAENGVLPDIKAHRIQRPSASAARARPKADSADGLDDGLGNTVEQDEGIREVFGLLRQLLTSQRGGQGAQPGMTIPAMYGSIPLAPVAATNEVLQALSQIQFQSVQQVSAIEGSLPVIDLRTALATQLPVVSGGARNVAQMDQDVIDIVAMLFEFILDDRNLPDDIKALLSRLQIPMLKVGLLDKAFFSKRQHPARKLLNDLAQAAIGWDPVRRGGKDGLHAKIESIVGRVLSDFQNDLGIFSVLLTEFEQYADSESRRVSLIEKRTREAEEGRAKADNARAEVNSVIHPLIADKRAPDLVRAMLANAWSNVLFLMALRDGPESAVWHKAVQTARDLIWSVEAKRGEDERKALRARMPSLVEELKQGLSSIAYSQFETAKFFQELEEAHLRAFRDQTPPPKMAEPPLLVEEVAGEFENTAFLAEGMVASDTDEVDFSVFDEVERAPVVASPATPGADPRLERDALRDMDGLLAEDLAEFSADDAALLRQADIAPVAAPALSVSSPAVAKSRSESITLESPAAVEGSLPANDEFVLKVEALPLGAWIEVGNGDDDGRAIRCKLVAKIPSTGKLIFVNRTGIKVADYTRNGLAVALRRGSARLLDDAALFDRALEAVISNLRKLKTSD